MRIETLKKAGFATLASAGMLALTAGAAFAADAPKDPLVAGDTAWMITSSALVLMMTIPGLGLFYGGMVRKKNVLATLAQSFGATALITVLWMVIGYSIAFTPNADAGMNNWIGGFGTLFLSKVTLNSVNSLAPTIPESVYMFFQMTFAIITPA
ncbi:MAG: ammonium transporter, partial [Alphaproteobacteria bacterium]|nr:ammonium transporter [Alphaproteobacteria bacterium]